MDIGRILSLQGTMFLLVLIGIIIRRKNILTSEGKSILTDMLIYVFLPFNIANSFRMDFDMNVLVKFVVILLFATIAQVICMTLSRILYKGEDEKKRKVLQYATVCSNSGFMGIPVVEGVFGAEGLMYGSVCLIPQRIVMWTAGISCFTEAGSKKDAIKRVIIHPCIVAVYIGLILMLFQIQLPDFIDKTLKNVGNCTTSVSMILIGAILGEITDVKSIFSKTLFFYTGVRLFLIPLLVLVACKIGGVNSLSTGIEVLISGMPAGSTTAILASKYNGDYIFAGKCIVVTTILSIITIPLWCMLI